MIAPSSAGHVVDRASTERGADGSGTDPATLPLPPASLALKRALGCLFGSPLLVAWPVMGFAPAGFIDGPAFTKPVDTMSQMD